MAEDARLLLLRHGPTDWNTEGRIQGRSDVPLSEEGIAEVERWRPPPAFADATWYASPLQRARQTAALLGHPEAQIAAALIEADWGDWEGEKLAALRARLGPAMTRNEARGLDFRPPGGESPRDLQERLLPFMSALAAKNESAVAVAHKGVLRAVYALARDWDMTGKPEQKMRNGCAHLFALETGGRPRLVQLNMPLGVSPERGAGP